MIKIIPSSIFSFLFIIIACGTLRSQELKINNDGYFEAPGLTVMVHNDIYPEGHQGGITGGRIVILKKPGLKNILKSDSSLWIDQILKNI